MVDHHMFSFSSKKERPKKGTPKKIELRTLFYQGVAMYIVGSTPPHIPPYPHCLPIEIVGVLSLHFPSTHIFPGQVYPSVLGKTTDPSPEIPVFCGVQRLHRHPFRSFQR